MKHKYVIEKNLEQNQLVIKEFAELDKEILSFLYQETYPEEKIAAALAAGRPALVDALRTPNMYPSGLFALKIADAVATLYGAESGTSSEVVMNDIDFVEKPRGKRKVVEEIEEEDSEIDDLLEDDFEDDFEEKTTIKKLDASLEIDDDEYDDYDDDEK